MRARWLGLVLALCGPAAAAPPAPGEGGAAAWREVDEAEALVAGGKHAEAEARVGALAARCGAGPDCAAAVEDGRAMLLLAGGNPGAAQSLLVAAAGAAAGHDGALARLAFRRCAAARALEARLEARQRCEEAAALAQRAGDARVEAAASRLLGAIWDDLGDRRAAEAARRRARALASATGEAAASEVISQRAWGHRAGDGRSVYASGAAWGDAAERQRELVRHQRAAFMLRAAGDLAGEAAALDAQGYLRASLGEKRQALDLLERALPLWRRAGDPAGEALTLSNLGNLWADLGEPRKAMEAYQAALALRRALGHAAGQGATLNNLGALLADLGEPRRALALYEEALPLRRAAGDLFGVAATLNSLGNAWSSLGEPARALEYYGQALPLRRAAGDRTGEARTLQNMGKVWSDLGDGQAALAQYQQALPLWQALGDRAGEAATLSNVGVAWERLGEHGKALEALEQALPLRRAVGDRAGEALTLRNMAAACRAGAPARSILHAKQAVAIYQSLRADVRGLGAATERAYAGSVSGAYRLLADLLVDEGRLAEAQAVLDLLKDDELKRLLRREAGPGQVPFTAQERALDGSYQALAAALAEAEAEAASLRQLQSPAPEQRAQLEALEGQLEARRAALRSWWDGLAAGLAQGERRREAEGRELATICRSLRTLGDGTVAVYTVAGERRVRLLVYSAEGDEPAAEFAIDARELGRRVFALRQALAEPGADVKPAAAALWEVLVGPIDQTLVRLKAKGVLWSLDGPLRYVPMAALWDARRGTWLAQRLRSGVITTASLAGLTDRPSPAWSALALGVSRVPPGSTGNEGLTDLRWVPAELGAVVRSKESPAGALPGKALPDGEFTLARLQEELKQRRPVLHVASHYVFRPTGEGEGSFLLLGDGSHLTLKALSGWRSGALADVELLTLSACETAIGADPGELDGAEVDGLSMVAQQKGAAAVLATLWPVDDPATAAFMREFYRRRQAGLSKGEALRQAQLAFLERKVTPAGAARSLPRGLKPPTGAAARAPPDWVHPSYWAPFTLLGNGR